MPLERDRVYVIPPQAYLSVREGMLRLSQPQAPHGARLPFDFFLSSLADGYGEAGLFPSGYDWSGIRDSSDMSKILMAETAMRILAPYTKTLTAIGLPAALVADLTDKPTVDEPVGIFDEVVVTPRRKKAN